MVIGGDETHLLQERFDIFAVVVTMEHIFDGFTWVVLLEIVQISRKELVRILCSIREKLEQQNIEYSFLFVFPNHADTDSQCFSIFSNLVDIEVAELFFFTKENLIGEFAIGG